ncbi:MAG: riboflavin synthase [Synechococcaceae cyanobacterium ELA263]
MFTGLVQAIGWLERCPDGVKVRLDIPGSLGALALGDSVSVDGICLTVAALLGEAGAAAGFRADVSEETLRRSLLGSRAQRGERVNLEPALRLSDRLGGHLVSGHVDGVGTVRAIERQKASWRLELVWNDPAYGRYVCEKASVAVDGVSLTVAGCSMDGARFWIAVIPHTWASCTLQDRRPGDGVNLEADLLAKYTERLLAAARSGGGEVGAETPLSSNWLAEQGWGG